MHLNLRFAAAIGLAAAILLMAGKPASAQTITPTENPFHVVTGTTKSEAFTFVNTTGETIQFELASLTLPPEFSLNFGSGAFTLSTVAAGEARLVADVFRAATTAAPGTTATTNYGFVFIGQSSGNRYSNTGTITLIADAAGTPPAVPEPSAAALMLPALGAFPLLKLRRRKRPEPAC